MEEEMESPDIPIELTEIAIYSPLTPNNLAEVFERANSPVIVDCEEGWIHYDLKDHDSIGGGMISEYSPSIFSDTLRKTGDDLDKTITEIVGVPYSDMHTDESVNNVDSFIANYKPVIDFLRSQGVNFCLVGRDEEDKPDLVGHYSNGKSTINPNFEYKHRKLLE